MLPGSEIKSLTGIRGIAAVAVMLAHAQREGNAQGYLLPGQPWVDLFFALSGFVIAMQYIKADTPVAWRKYAVARLARIYPLHITTVLLTIAIWFAAHLVLGVKVPSWLNAHQLLSELTLTTAMPIVGVTSPIVFTSWSLSVEWWTYFLVLPLLLLCLRFGSDRLVILVSALAAVALVVALYTLTNSGPTRGWLALARAGVGFATGVAALLMTRRTAFVPSGLLVDLICLVTLAAILTAPFTGSYPWYCILLYPLMVFGLARSGPKSFWGRLFASRIVMFLGVISYSIYLLHPVVIRTVSSLPHSDRISGPWAWMLIISILTVAGSWITYRLVEIPGKQLLRKLGERHQTPKKLSPVEPGPLSHVSE